MQSACFILLLSIGRFFYSLPVDFFVGIGVVFGMYGGVQ